jgi:transposase
MLDLLDELAIDVAVAHPKEVKAIAKAKIKTDKRDSWMLAHLLRTELIPEVYRRSGENRQCQRVLRQRGFYVGNMTRVKHRLRSLLAQQPEEIREEFRREENIFGEKELKMV